MLEYVVVIVCILYIIIFGTLKIKYKYWYEQPLCSVWTPAYLRLRIGMLGANESFSRGITIHNQDSSLSFIKHADIRIIRVLEGENAITPPILESMAFLLQQDKSHEPPQLTFQIKEKITIIRHYSTQMLKSWTIGHNSPVFLGLHERTRHLMQQMDVISTRELVSAIMMVPMNCYFHNEPPFSLYTPVAFAWQPRGEERLALIDTTEFVQKTREPSVNKSLYKYSDIPSFIVPFTQFYTYTFDMRTWKKWRYHLPAKYKIVRVNRINLETYFGFLRECMSHTFTCMILPEFSSILHLINNETFDAYMLLENNRIVNAIYIMASPGMKRLHTETRMKMEEYQNKMREPEGVDAQFSHQQRIKRLKKAQTTVPSSKSNVLPDSHVLYLKNSVRSTTCDVSTFVCGFINVMRDVYKRRPHHTIRIDTISHNFHIIDDILQKYKATSIEKWHYLFYNYAIKTIGSRDLFLW